MSLTFKIFLVFIFYTLFQFFRAMLNSFKVSTYNNDDKLILVTLDLSSIYLIFYMILILIYRYVISSKVLFNVVIILDRLFVYNCILLSFIFITSLILVINKYNYSKLIKNNYEDVMIKIRELRYRGFIGLLSTLLLNWLIYLFMNFIGFSVSNHIYLILLMLIPLFITKHFYTLSSNIMIKCLNNADK